MLRDHVMRKHESLHSQAYFLHSHKTGRVLLNIHCSFMNWFWSCSDIVCMHVRIHPLAQTAESSGLVEGLMHVINLDMLLFWKSHTFNFSFIRDQVSHRNYTVLLTILVNPRTQTRQF